MENSQLHTPPRGGHFLWCLKPRIPVTHQGCYICSRESQPKPLQFAISQLRVVHPKFPPGGLGGFGGDQLWETFLETWFFKESVISPVNRTLAIENLDPTRDVFPMEKWWYNKASYVSLSDGRLVDGFQNLVYLKQKPPNKAFPSPFPVIWNNMPRNRPLAVRPRCRECSLRLDLMKCLTWWRTGLDRILLAWKFICFAAEIFHPLERGIWSNLKVC